MNELGWILIGLSITALAAMLVDQFLIPEWHDTKSPFRAFDTYIDDLLAGNGARIRRNDRPMLD